MLTADVYSLAGPKKRKRSELALALDNQSINLYDVRTGASSIVHILSSFPGSIFKTGNLLYRLSADDLYLSTMLNSISWSETDILLDGFSSSEVTVLPARHQSGLQCVNILFRD